MANNNFLFGGQVFKSPFERSHRKDGWVAKFRIDNRVVIVQGTGLQPRDDGKQWSFRIRSENGGKTVYFATLAFPSDAAVKTAVSLYRGYRSTTRKPVEVINARDYMRIPAKLPAIASGVGALMMVREMASGKLVCTGARHRSLRSEASHFQRCP